MNKEKILYLVVPCYNEEEVLKETTKRLTEKFKALMKDKVISKDSKVLYVNDGSKDKTWKMIGEIKEKNSIFTGISLSRNRGHQNALLAGLMEAKNHADVIISMDADLQDDINAIDGMLEKYYEGNDIVYGVRSKRKTDTWFKRTTAEAFYKFMKVMGVDVIYNHADYRLTSKRVLDEFENYKEVNLFLRGIFPLIGYKTDIVYYERTERFAGESKYPLKKMLNFAWDGITSFSDKPIRFVLFFGILLTVLMISTIFVVGILDLIYLNVSTIFYILTSIFLCSGFIISSVGIVGEYVGKTYKETKARPKFLVAENLMED